MNNENFDIEKYKNFSEKDLKFLVEIEINDEKYLKLKKRLDILLATGDKEIFKYLV